MSFVTFFLCTFAVSLISFANSRPDKQNSDFRKGENNNNFLTLELLEDLRSDIEERINLFTRPDDEDDTLPLLATIVRLIFHDCGGQGYSNRDEQRGICNGCINPFSPDHAGLEFGVIYPLEQVYQNENIITTDRYEESIIYDPTDSIYTWTNPSNTIWSDILTRGDFWSIAGTMAIEYGVELAFAEGDIDESGVPRPETWNDVLGEEENIRYFYGRYKEGCDNDTPFNEDPETTRFNVSQFWGFNNLFNFFNKRFDFDEANTVAIMGAHSLGRAHPSINLNDILASENDDTLCCGGTGHREGWVQKNTFMFDNGYYNQLMTFHDFTAVWEQQSPCIQSNDVCDDGFLTEPEALQWKVKRCAPEPNTCTTNFHQMMLNVDMSIAFDIDSYLDEESINGKVNCNHPLFNANKQDFSVPSCPRNFGEDNGIKEEFDEYVIDNREWLIAFWHAWSKMIQIGYHELNYVELPN